jgi:hypothetical protein
LSTFVTTSTTGYATFVMALLIFFTSSQRIASTSNNVLFARKFFKKLSLIMIVSTLLFSTLMIYASINFGIKLDDAISLLLDSTIAKGAANSTSFESGKERSGTVFVALSIFMQNPIIGTGYGKNRSFDLITTILSNTGILGLLSFSIMILASIKLAKSVEEFTDNRMFRSLAYGFRYSLILGIFAMCISVPDLIFQFFWLILSFISSLYNIAKNERLSVLPTPIKQLQATNIFQ